MENPEILRREYQSLRGKGYNWYKIVGIIAKREGVRKVAVAHGLRMLGILRMNEDFTARYREVDRKLDGLIAEGLDIGGMAERLGKEERAKGSQEVIVGERKVYQLLTQHCKLGEYRKSHRKNMARRTEEADRERWEWRRAVLRLTAEEGGKESVAGEILGMGKERARQLMGDYGFHDVWQENVKKNKKGMKREKDFVEYLGKISGAVLFRLCSDGAEYDWQRDAARYCIVKNVFERDGRLEQIMKLIKIYDGCAESGEKISYKRMGEETGLDAMTTRKILADLGRKSLCGSLKPHRKMRIGQN